MTDFRCPSRSIWWRMGYSVPADSRYPCRDNSSITHSPYTASSADQTFQAGRVTVRGYALAATGTSLARVQVSVDGGLTFEDARLLGDDVPFAWRHWEATPTLRPGPAVLAVRAWDTSGAAQPEEPPWNFKGYYFNGWHRVPVRVV